jgi:predicted DNA-binding antitoxin AbrB/MazE fold protein
MMNDVPAIYENGYLRLLEPVDLAEGELVMVTIILESEPDVPRPDTDQSSVDTNVDGGV